MKKNKNNPIISILILVNLVGLILVSWGLWTNYHALQNFKQTQTSSVISAGFKCDSDKTIQALYLNNNVELTLSDGRNLMLMQGVSGSGTRYTNGDESITFWNKGNTAFIEENNTETYQNCVQTSE